MQRKMETEINLGKSLFPFDSIGSSSAIDSTASNFLNANEKVQQIKKLIETGEYDGGIAKYILGTLELVYQGMLETLTQKINLHIFRTETWKN